MFVIVATAATVAADVVVAGKLNELKAIAEHEVYALIQIYRHTTIETSQSMILHTPSMRLKRERERERCISQECSVRSFIR